MARSKTDLPRMQNPARSRTAFERGTSIVGQVLDKGGRQRSAPMMRQYDLIERVRRYNPDTNEALLNRAYVYAMRAHGEQKRASGDPYFSHPLEVAAILTDLKLDDATIAAALLHDTIEDTPTTRAEIDQLFGPDIGHLVEGLTKLKRLDLVSARGQAGREPAQASACDRRRRARAAGQARRPAAQHAHAPPHAAGGRRRTAEETLDIYAPLAGRMGMQGLREELEDLAFRELNPEAHRVVTERLDRSRRAKRGPDRRDRAPAHPQARRVRHHDRGATAGASGPIRSGARWSASRSASSSSPTSSASG